MPQFTAGGQLDLISFHGVRGGGKGGGSPPPAPPPTYTSPSDAMVFNSPAELNAHLSQLQQEKDATAAANQAKADAATAKNEQDFLTRRGEALTGARQNVNRAFQLAGVDPSLYAQSDIDPALNRAASTIQDLDPNPSSAFSPTLGQDIINSITTGKRGEALRGLNQTFTPTYANTALPSSLLDPQVTSLVNEQFDPLTQQLTNARNRGTLTDPGYNAALAALQQKRSGAEATVRNLGEGILSGERNDLGDYISGARSTASGLNLADTFDPSAYTSEAGRRVQTDISGLPGALRNAVGGTQFATLQDLMNAGGASQGATNALGPTPAGGAGAATDLLDPNKKRGLGTQGAF